MLPLDLVEQPGGDLGIAPVEPFLGFGVKRFDVAGDIGGVGAGLLSAEHRATRKGDDGEREDESGAMRAGKVADHARPIASAWVNAK